MVQQGNKFSTTYQVYQTICHDINITYGDGTSDRFALKLSPERQGMIPIYEVKVNFVCETNPKLKLQLNGDNQALLYGNELVFDDESMFGSRNYILTREDGTRWYLSAEHGLLKMEDTNGNT
ncbi:MAG: hypothetical protein IJA10_03780, partial [Lachnospiraceae bacterium]|nr:hypothetical protein [Lachnospiraceae bacterium]